MADEPVFVQLECVQFAITAEKALPAYDKQGRVIAYSSEKTAATATFVMGDLPVSVAVAMDEHGNPSISELVKALHHLVGNGVRMVAEVKALNGVTLPVARHIDTAEAEKGL